MAEGQEYAQILPRSNAAGLFAQNFLRSRQTAEQRDILRAQQEAKMIADKKKQDDADLNELLKFKDGLSTGFKDVKEYAREGVDKTLVDMHSELTKQLQQGQRDPIKFRQLASQFTDKATEIKRWGEDIDKAAEDLTKYYSPVAGVNANGVRQLVNLAVKRGVPKDKIQDFVNQNVDELIENEDGLIKPFKEIGTQTVGIGTGNNGRMTAGKSTMTIPNDSELDGKGLGTRVIPKGETVALSSLDFGVTGMNKGVEKFKGLDDLADKDGNLHLYDEDYYKSLMENKGAELFVNKIFKAHVKKYEETTGKPFPISEQIVDMAKRAIVYKKREELVDGKYNAVAAQQIAPRITVVNNNGGGSSKGAEAVTVKEIQAKIDRAVALSPNGFVSAVDLPGDEQDAVLEQARKAAKADDAKEMDANNIGVQKGANGKSEIIYTKADGVTKVRLKTMDRLNTDVPKQPGIKEKRKVIGGGGTPAAVPAQKNKTVVTPGNVR